MHRHVLLLLLATMSAPGGSVTAQGKGPKRYAVTRDRAAVVTREVLVKHGYQVIRIETVGNDQIVWYRAGNRGRGRGKGPPVKMVIRRDPVANKIVFLETPSSILVDIDVRLRL